MDCEQHSPEWREFRRGHLTASRIAVLKPLKNGSESELCRKYKLELLSEVLTGRMAEHYVSLAMDWGTEQEKNARTEYELAKDVMVDRIGFVLHPTLPRCGASPDGLIGDDGLVEIKCPITANHIDYLMGEVVPEKYAPQMYWQMACTGRQYCDFASFDPRMDEKFQLFIARLERDEKKIAEWEELATAFISDLNRMAEVLMSHANKKPVSIEEKLRASIKQCGKYPNDAELLAQLREEGISVP